MSSQKEKTGPRLQSKALSRDRATETYEHILDASEEIVIEHGGRELTLEAAARAAGLSKGGVLYHFPSKAALIQAMLTRLIARFETDLQSIAEEDGAPEACLTAYVQATFRADERDKRMGAALLAVLAEDPALLKPLRAFYQRRFEALRSPGMRFDRAATVMLAVEGLFMLELLGLSYLSTSEREELERTLLAVASGSGTGHDV
ncbi:MAG: TetR/AcrR family transcriptional regulator [Pseudomonadota bacterium]